MAGAHSVDVVGFQVLHIPLYLGPAHGAPGAAAPFMAVYAAEHDPFSVQQHLAALALKFAQTHRQLGAFGHGAVVFQADLCGIQLRLFGAPQGGAIYR